MYGDHPFDMERMGHDHWVMGHLLIQKQTQKANARVTVVVRANHRLGVRESESVGECERTQTQLEEMEEQAIGYQFD
jgi:hypothetical protein